MSLPLRVGAALSAFRRVGRHPVAARLLLMAVLIVCTSVAAPAYAQNRTLSLYNTHTHERLTVTYKRNGRFVQAGLNQLNRFLRDWRRDEVTRIDPDLFDIVWTVYQEVGASEPIHVVSAYRSPATNDMLRRRSSGVARNSQHTQGRAMDFFIPGVRASEIRAAGLRLELGGVGYYPRSATPFVHLDTGSVRMWPRMTRSQLQAVFPDGRTIHIPSDGQPLRGFEIAQRDAQRRAGRAPSPTTSAGDAPSTGDDGVVIPNQEGNSLLATLFGGGNDQAEPATQPAPATAPVQTAVQSEPEQPEPASEPREPYQVASPVLPPYATSEGTAAEPSALAGSAVPSPVAAPTIDDIQLTALNAPTTLQAADPAPLPEPQPEPRPGAIALENAFALAQNTPQAPSLTQLPPVTREEQIAQTVPAPGQIAALIEARYAEQRAAQASLAGQVDQAFEVAAVTPAIPGIEAFLEPQESLLAPGTPSPAPEAIALSAEPRFVPPVPTPISPSTPAAAPASIEVAAAPPIAPASPSSNQDTVAAQAFAPQPEARTPAQSAIAILTGSTSAQTQAITGRLYPIENDLTAALDKQSIRGSQHAALLPSSGVLALSPVLMRDSTFVPARGSNARTDSFD